MSLENLDTLDRKILSELDKNARISYSDLGKKIKAAKETVKYRIMQLEKHEIISGYYTAFNFSKLGNTFYRFYLRLKDTSPEKENEIIDYLIKSKNVSVVYRINGSYHLAVGMWARNIWEYQYFWVDFKKKFGQYISNYHFSLFSEYLEFSRAYLLPKSQQEKSIFSIASESEPADLDGKDYGLISFLAANARASISDVSRKTGMSIVSVRHRLKRLIKSGIIAGFRPIINISALGMEYYKVDLWLSKFDNYESIKTFISSQTNVVYAEQTLLSGDIEFDLEIENFANFIRLMDMIRAKFPGDIKDYSYYSMIKNYKTSHVPSTLNLY